MSHSEQFWPVFLCFGLGSLIIVSNLALGVRLKFPDMSRDSGRCGGGIKFTLSLDCLQIFFSKITYPFSQKTHECALKLTDLRNTSLLFDLNYKFELIGASLLALAKSIYLPVLWGQGAVPSEYITYPLIPFNYIFNTSLPLFAI